MTGAPVKEPTSQSLASRKIILGIASLNFLCLTKTGDLKELDFMVVECPIFSYL